MSGGGQLSVQFRLTGAKVSLNAPTAAAAGSTHYVAATYDGAMARFFVDGMQVASRPASGTFTGYDTTHGFAMGEDGGLTAPPFQGRLQHVALYARALPSGEIDTHVVASGLGGTYPIPTPAPPGPTATPTIAPTATPTSVPTGAPVPGPALLDPPQLSSVSGSLTFNVTAMEIAGKPTFAYNGGTVPPTLHLFPGDTLRVNFTNALPQPPAGAGYTNTSSLHYHGLGASPQAPADDSIDFAAAPGQTLHYTIPIPLTTSPGLYWYHTHVHGEAERQTLAGMSGALVIDGLNKNFWNLAGLKERVLIVRDGRLPGVALPAANRRQMLAMRWAMAHGVTMRSSMGTSMRRATSDAMVAETSHNPFVTRVPRFRMQPLASPPDQHCLPGSPEGATAAFTVNGQAQPSIAIAPGERQFWRVVNAGADTYLDLAIDNAPMRIIAIDGVALANSFVSNPIIADHYVLPPASRVEFAITGPPGGTPAFVRTRCFDSGATGLSMPAQVLAALSPVASNVATAKVSSDFAPRRRALRAATPKRAVAAKGAWRMSGMAMSAHSAVDSAHSIMDVPIALNRTIDYTDQYTIDGVAYDPAAPPAYYAQLGTAQDWTIVNSQTEVHTFHIHQVHFVLEAINGVPQPQQLVMDNVNVPPGGSVRLRLAFTDRTILGTFLFHCHILSHEDSGMMAKIRVGLSPPLATNASTISFVSAHAASQTVTISGGAQPYRASGCNGFASASISRGSMSVSPDAAGSCVMTVSDSSTPALTTSVAVNVTAGAPTISIAPSAISFSSTGGSAANVSIVGGTPPFSANGCTGIASGSIASRTLSVAAFAVGACSLVVSDASRNSASLAVSVNAAPATADADNLTFHQNNSRTGWDAFETTLTTSNVASSHFGFIGTLVAPTGMPAMSKVIAQPLFASAERTADGTHDLLLAASTSAQVYAFDGRTEQVVWHHSFTGGNVIAQPWTDSGCGDINPAYGIVGTPVIDRALDRLYVVVATDENGVPVLRLHALSLSTGVDAMDPAPIEQTVAQIGGGSSSVSPQFNMNRSALLEANGNIYVALGSHCDAHSATTHGWLLSYDARTLRQTGSANFTNGVTSDRFYLGSPWMSGFGPAADAAGNVYFATGNGAYDGRNDFAMSVIKIPGNLDLAAASKFTPASAATDSTHDLDLGSGGVLLFPDQAGPYPHQLLQGGKCSYNGSLAWPCWKYVLNRDSLGGQQAGNAGALGVQNIAGMMFGGPAYFRDGNGQHVIYGGDPLTSYIAAPDARGVLRISPQASTSVGCFVCRDSGGSQPIVSSNGTTAGTAIVWVIKGNPPGGGPMSLYAFDAIRLGTPLFSGRAGFWNVTGGSSYVGSALVSPTVANGRVYVPVDGGVAVFGLR